MNYIGRQNKVIGLLKSESLDALLISKKQNISYLTGCRGDDAILFVSARENCIITDARYKEEYSRAIRNCAIKITKDADVTSCVKEISTKTRSRRIGFEPDNFSYSGYAKLKHKLNNVLLIPAHGIVERLRKIKDDKEIELIRKACISGCKVMNYAINTVHPSLSEIAVRNNIEKHITKQSFEKAGFDIIVASGANASMPHASASLRKIKKGEMVIIDLGIMNCGYNSDLTRTIFLGRIDPKYRRIFNIVLDAKKKAIEIIKPGIPACRLDNISRKYITSKGLGKYFIHSLGHGIGLDVHESPSISRKSQSMLEKNMTITIEPGIYIPGWGGVRIEDVVLVTENGCEVLTNSATNPDV